MGCGEVTLKQATDNLGIDDMGTYWENDSEVGSVENGGFPAHSHSHLLSQLTFTYTTHNNSARPLLQFLSY